MDPLELPFPVALKTWAALLVQHMDLSVVVTLKMMAAYPKLHMDQLLVIPKEVVHLLESMATPMVEELLLLVIASVPFPSHIGLYFSLTFFISK